MDAQGGKCSICGGRIKNVGLVTIDHVTPRIFGGANNGNRLLAHATCNISKGERMPRPCELLLLEAANLRVLA